MAVAENTKAPTVGMQPRPGGPPGGHVSEFQRSRMIAAAIEAIEDLGYARMTVAQVIRRARVSRKTFYEAFSDREDCFLAVCEVALANATVAAKEAYAGESAWCERIRAALAGLLVFIDQQPGLARLLVVESLLAGPRVSERRAEVLDGLAEILDEGRGASDCGHLPALTGDAILGGVLAVIHSHLSRGRTEPFTELLGPLMSTIAMPYLGAGTARSELERPAPPRPEGTRSPATGRELREGLEMRLTYRTLRVLTMIASHPGASNREIAEGSGILDQGQVSKLLNRLARLGLAENLGDGHKPGAVNAWHLTTQGARLERASRPML
jgi:AcrR family transcriptional regulator